nr:GFA family protein [Bradyrhizobium sp. CCBAU 51745]
MTDVSKPFSPVAANARWCASASRRRRTKVSICHCHMRQKGVGAPFASFADINKTDFAWTKGKLSFFRSSTIAELGFCAAGGMPLSFGRIDGDRIEFMTGAFDRPDRCANPAIRHRIRLGWVVGISNLPSQTTQQNYGPEKMATIVSHQHPDHD